MFKNGTGKLSRVKADNVKNFEVKSSRFKKVKPPKVNVMVRGQRITLGDVEVKGEKISCNMCKRKGLNMKDGRCTHCTKETKKFKPVNPVEQRIKEITPQYRKDLRNAKNLDELKKVKDDYHWRKFRGVASDNEYFDDFDNFAFKYRDSEGRNGFRIISEIGNEYADRVLSIQLGNVRTVGDLLNLKVDIDDYFEGVGTFEKTPYVIRVENQVKERIKKMREMMLNE